MRAVIFDWDLTLWNSWDIHLWLMERTGFDLGIIPPGAEAVAAEFHRPFHQHLLWFFGSTPDSQGELDTIVAAYLHHYHAIVGHRNYLYPGVASLLRGLRRRGIRIGILSDKVPEFGEAELRQSGIADLVEYTSFKTDRRPFKPDPTGLFHVLEGLGVEAADTMYVGDAPQDIACARTGFDLGIIPPGAEAVAAEFHRPFHQHLLWFFGSTPDSQGELDTIVAAYLHHYHAIVGHRNYLYPGVASLLRGLRRRGIRIGILSDKVPEFGEAELRQSGIADLVEYTSFKTDRRPFKPDPTGLFHVLEGLGVEAADTMYVGDAPQDIACARDAGVRSAAAMWATIDADAIIVQQPTHRLHRPH